MNLTRFAFRGRAAAPAEGVEPPETDITAPDQEEPNMELDKQVAEAIDKAVAEAFAKEQAEDTVNEEDEEAAAADAAEIATLATAAGVPAMAAALIKDGVSLEVARTRIDGAKEIRAAVELGRKSCSTLDAGLADQYIAAGASIEFVRSDLFTRMNAAQAAQTSAHQAGTGKPGTEAGEPSWKKAVDKVNARVPA